MDAKTNNETGPPPYHVRCQGSPRLRSALKNEQARRLLQTGEKANVMDIAAEWLEEKAAQVGP